MSTITPRAARRTRAFAPIAAAALAVVALAPRAFADGDSRPATGQEQKFHALVAGAFKKALPAGPKGWVEEREPIEPLDRVATGAENYPFRVSYRVRWTDKKKLDQAKPETLAALTKIMTAPDPAWQQLVSRNAALAAELGQAVGRGDKETATRLSREIEAVQKQMGVINAERDQRLQQALRETSPRDTGLAVTLTANEFSESFHRETAAEAPIGGGLVFRTKEQFTENSGWREGTTCVLLGKGWQLVQEGGSWAETKPRPGTPSLAVQTIVVRVDAEAARARAFLAKVDWEALKKLLVK